MNRRKRRFSFAPEDPGAPAPESRVSVSAGAGPTVLTVQELTQGIRRLLESAYGRVAVRGEVSGLSRPSSGHVYFTLRDATATRNAQVAVVVWRNEAVRLRFRLEDGLRVVVAGRLTVYEPRGSYQLIAERVEPDGLGEIALAFERLKTRLAAEGLFSAERKRGLPFLPRRIGLVTSPTGAAVQDVLRSIYRRHPRAWVRIVPVRVQGEGSAEEVAAALDFCGRPEAGVDVVIVARGGGGLEDLWTFNEERVVRAVAGCAVPTVSAIGHEVDFTLCDFAADVRAQTPTHAGDLVVPDLGEIHRNLRDHSRRLAAAVGRRWSLARERVDRLAASRALRSPRELLRFPAQRVDDLGRQLQKGLYNTYLRWQDTLRRVSGKLEVLNPLQVLKRGYAVAFDDRGKVVRRAAELAAGDPLRLLLGEGSAQVRVEAPSRSALSAWEGEEAGRVR